MSGPKQEPELTPQIEVQISSTTLNEGRNVALWNCTTESTPKWNCRYASAEFQLADYSPAKEQLQRGQNDKGIEIVIWLKRLCIN